MDPYVDSARYDGAARDYQTDIPFYRALAKAAGGTLDHIVKLTVYLTSLNDFAAVNTVMAEFFTEPYPARAAVEVAGLPKGVPVEIDAILSLP